MFEVTPGGFGLHLHCPMPTHMTTCDIASTHGYSLFPAAHREWDEMCSPSGVSQLISGPRTIAPVVAVAQETASQQDLGLVIPYPDSSCIWHQNTAAGEGAAACMTVLGETQARPSSINSEASRSPQHPLVLHKSKCTRSQGEP